MGPSPTVSKIKSEQSIGHQKLKNQAMNKMFKLEMLTKTTLKLGNSLVLHKITGNLKHSKGKTTFSHFFLESKTMNNKELICIEGNITGNK